MPDRTWVLTVNGLPRPVRADVRASLLDVLREELGLTGTKYGCGEGECGACTVLVDGAPQRSCQLRAAEIGVRPIVTIEGVAERGTLSPVQRAFLEKGAFQCGFCTPGMVVAATAFLRSHPAPTREEIRTALEGNLCRCGGYSRILAAVERAAELARAKREGP